jgi:hypothetical protein
MIRLRLKHSNPPLNSFMIPRKLGADREHARPGKGPCPTSNGTLASELPSSAARPTCRKLWDADTDITGRASYSGLFRWASATRINRYYRAA